MPHQPFEPPVAVPSEPELMPAEAIFHAPGKSILREYAEALLIAFVLAFFIRSFIVQAFKIPSGSMQPTLEVGDHILVNKFAYGVRLPLIGTNLLVLGEPRRGDVIVFAYPLDPSKDYIKRVVGVGGDLVQIRNKHIYINGSLWNDPHAYFADGESGRQGTGPRDTFGPVTVPPGHFFVMGDNRDHSYDSRFWGFVDSNEVMGKAFLIYWSWDGIDRWVRWDRLGDVIR